MIAPAHTRAGMTLVEACNLQEFPDPEWCIAGVLMANSLVSVTGPPALYKSFFAQDQALSVACGIPWQGRAVRQAPTVYVVAEGRSGIRRRVRAWEIRHQRPARGCYILPRAVQLLEPSDVESFYAAIDALGITPGLIVFDTQARCTVGMEENSAREGGVLVAVLDDIRQRYHTTVMLIHHNGRNGLMRGTTALPGAIDTHIELAKDGADRVIASCGKQKDAEPFAPITLVRRVVELDETGATSLVLDAIEQERDKPLTDRQRMALSALDALGGQATASVWQRASGLPPSTFYLVADQLITVGRVRKHTQGRSKAYVSTLITPTSNSTPTQLQLE